MEKRFVISKNLLVAVVLPDMAGCTGEEGNE